MSRSDEDKPDGGNSIPPHATTAAATTPTPAPATALSRRPGRAAGFSHGSRLLVCYAGRTAVGLVRDENKDSFLIANLTTGTRVYRRASKIELVGECGLLFAVCDGGEGTAGGSLASQMAADVLLEAMRRGGAPRERDVLARRLVSAVEEAGRRIFDASREERSLLGMGTTATAAALIDKVLFVAQIGDSRAYLLRDGQLKQVTKDQTLVNQLIEAGHLTESEAEVFEHGEVILQSLGTSEAVQVDLTFVELRHSDRLMLCSDGLSDQLSADTLRDTLMAHEDPAECTAALIRNAGANGGRDNITIVIVDFDGEALEVPRETDSFGYLQYPLLPAAHGVNTFAGEDVADASADIPDARQFEVDEDASLIDLISLWTRVAERSHQSGELSDAVRALEHARNLAPHDVKLAHKLAGALLEQSSHLDEAGKAIALDRVADLLCNVALALPLEEAGKFLKSALGHAPWHARALNELESMTPDSDRASLAGHWVAYLAHNPDGELANERRVALARAYLAAEQLDDAIFTLELAAKNGFIEASELLSELRSAPVPALLDEAAFYLKLGCRDEATDTLERAIRVHGEHPELVVMLGCITNDWAVATASSSSSSLKSRVISGDIAPARLTADSLPGDPVDRAHELGSPSLTDAPEKSG